MYEKRRLAIMKFFQLIVEASTTINDNLNKASRAVFNVFSKPDKKDYNDLNSLYNQLSEESDKQRIANDFFKIGKDLYNSLDKYEAKHGF